MAGYDAWKATKRDADLVRLANIFVNRTHSGEEVAALAIGPGAQRMRGYSPNTHLFDVTMRAWGWTPDTAPAR